jgi:hypothetical protein
MLSNFKTTVVKTVWCKYTHIDERDGIQISEIDSYKYEQVIFVKGVKQSRRERVAVATKENFAL